MNLRTVYDGIAAVEERFDVDALRLEGVNVWIPIRSMFITPFTNHRDLTYREMLGARSHINPLATGRAMPQLEPDSVDVEFRRMGGMTYFRTSPGPVQVNPDLLFFHAFQDYSDVEDGGCYNRIADSVLDLYPEPERCVKVVRATPESLRARFTHTPWQFVEESNGLSPRPELPGEADLRRELDRIAVYCAQADIRTVYHSEQVLQRLRALMWRAEQFGMLLETCRPRAVVLSSFANIERMAMIVAARRAGVPSVDVEHGFMGYLSAYGRLGCVPDTGWDCLPDYFWVWGEESARLLERSLGSAAQVHRPVLGGSPVHQRRHHDDSPVHGAVREELQRMRASADRAALFCWQPDMLVHEQPASLLPSALREAMRRDPETLWLIRLHPRSRHLIPKVKRQLADIGHGNYDVDIATTDPLPALINFCDVVLTSYSTVAFEANEHRRPVVLVDEVGVAMMEDYVERDVFAAGIDGAGLLAAMDRVIGRNVEPIDYIHRDPTSHLDAFREILSGPLRRSASSPVVSADPDTSTHLVE